MSEDIQVSRLLGQEFPEGCNILHESFSATVEVDDTSTLRRLKERKFEIEQEKGNIYTVTWQKLY